MRIRYSILTAAVLVVLGASGQLMAQDQNEANAGDNNSTRGNNRDNLGLALALGGSAAADNNSTATSTTSDSFNTSSNTVVATTQLSGTVTGNGVSGLGNVANNAGSAGGGAGGMGGTGAGGSAGGGTGTGGDGGDGGDAGAWSDRAGDSSSGTQTAAAGAARVVGDVAQARYAVAGDRAAELGGGHHGVGTRIERIGGGIGGAGGRRAVVVRRGTARAGGDGLGRVVAVVAAGGIVVAGSCLVLVLGHELARGAEHDQDGRGENTVSNAHWSDSFGFVRQRPAVMAGIRAAAFPQERCQARAACATH